MAYPKSKVFFSVLGILLLIGSVKATEAIDSEEILRTKGEFFPGYYEKIPEYCQNFQGNQKKCSSGDTVACYQAGLALRPKFFRTTKSFRTVEASRCPEIKYAYNTSLAIEYFIKACDRGMGASCLEAASLNTPPFGKSYKEAARLYEKACNADEKSVKACREAGKLYRDGDYLKQDFKKARQYFEKGCSKEDTESCMNLADMQEKGEGFFLKSKTSAKELYGSLCEKGNLEACKNYKRLNQ